MYLKVKRAIDFLLSGFAIIILAPFWLLIIIAIKYDSPGPILFKQKRVGLNKTHFNILKFRTMKIDTPKDTPTHQLSNPKKYITSIGRFLRATSLDELPQIINILKGEMSIIGPRPALWNQYDLLEERSKYDANNVRPGLTGLAQITGRDELAISKKAKLDGEYVRNMGPLLDTKLFFSTLLSVAKKDGIVEGDNNQNSMKYKGD